MIFNLTLVIKIFSFAVQNIKLNVAPTDLLCFLVSLAFSLVTVSYSDDVNVLYTSHDDLTRSVANNRVLSTDISRIRCRIIRHMQASIVCNHLLL